MKDRKNDILALSLAYAKIIAKMDELNATDEEWNYANQLADKVKSPKSVGIHDAFALQLDHSSQIDKEVAEMFNSHDTTRTNGLNNIAVQEGDRILGFSELTPDGKQNWRFTTDRHLFEIMAVMDVVAFDTDDVMPYKPEACNCPVLKLKQWVIDEPMQGVKINRQMTDARCLEMATKTDGQ